MNAAIQSSLSNIAIIFLMHLCISNLIQRRERLSRYYLSFGVVLIVSLATILMFYLPIKYGGYQFDLRFIPLVFIALRWNWKVTISALLITACWRLGMGGQGAVPGVIFGMILPVLLTLAIRTFRKTGINPGMLFLLITSAWLISDLPIISLVPDGWDVFKEIAVMRFISFNLTAFTLYFFISSNEKEQRLKEQLQYYAERDPLTGLYNIRFFDTKVKSLRKTNERMYIVMIDIDHFKPINDTYGHLNGDYVLKSVAGTINKATSVFLKNDIVLGRYGGEEFILFITANSEAEMIQLVEGIRDEIENTDFYTENHEHTIHLTVSLGVAEFNDCSQLHEAINNADNSLYASKKKGRNQINYAN